MVKWLGKIFKRQPMGKRTSKLPKLLDCNHAATTFLKFKCRHLTCYPCYKKAGYKCGKCYGDALSNK